MDYLVTHTEFSDLEQSSCFSRKSANVSVLKREGKKKTTSQREAQLCLWMPGVSTGNNRLEAARENLLEYDRSQGSMACMGVPEPLSSQAQAQGKCSCKNSCKKERI